MGRKDRERAERGILHRNGKLVSREEAEKIDGGKKVTSVLRRNPLVGLQMLAQHRLGRQHVPDLRCPWCDSSRMAKEGLDTCPECGYEGDPVDKNAPAEEATEEEQKAMIAKAYEEAGLEAENGKEDSQAVHNADTGGRNEHGEESGEGRTPE